MSNNNCLISTGIKGYQIIQIDLCYVVFLESFWNGFVFCGLFCCWTLEQIFSSRWCVCGGLSLKTVSSLQTSHEMIIQCLSRVATHPFHGMSSSRLSVYSTIINKAFTSSTKAMSKHGKRAVIIYFQYFLAVKLFFSAAHSAYKMFTSYEKNATLSKICCLVTT